MKYRIVLRAFCILSKKGISVMTMEFDSRKREGKPGCLYKFFKVAITIGVFVIAMFFLLMVIFPAGGWTQLFWK